MDMQYRILGRTGLRVSLLSMGSGGPSQFGQKSAVSESDIGRLVHEALEAGINFFDSSAGYGESEAILGRILKDVPRESYIMATKFQAGRRSHGATPKSVVKSVEHSLDRLGIECIDLLQFHGVAPDYYAQARDDLMPTLGDLREQGKIRYIGITETYSGDSRHEMLPLAIADDCFDTIMVGYNLLSPTPEHLILPACAKKNIGVICMVPVRRALSRPEYLAEQIDYAKKKGLISPDALPERDPLGWLVHGDVRSLPAAGYKYVAAHPAVHTVLTGTSRVEHLEENLDAILGPPLPEADTACLRKIFGDVWEPLGN